MELAGVQAVVTGGASGLGAACVRMLMSAGVRVLVLDRDPSMSRAVDVTDAGQVEAALREFGAVQVVVNCAGIAPSERVLGRNGPADLEAFERTLRINVVGTYNVIRLAAAIMAENEPNAQGERGVIINTASVAAYDGQIGQTAYAASKAAIVGMTLPLARDLARHGIRAMAIAPGIFDTPMVQGFSDEVRAALGAAVPFPPRLGQPEEFAALVRHIIENPMLNGEVIRLDGALRMGPK